MLDLGVLAQAAGLFRELGKKEVMFGTRICSRSEKLSGPLRLRVQSRSRARLRIAASIAFLFRAYFKGVLDTIAPLSRG